MRSSQMLKILFRRRCQCNNKKKRPVLPNRGARGTTVHIQPATLIAQTRLPGLIPSLSSCCNTKDFSWQSQLILIALTKTMHTLSAATAQLLLVVCLHGVPTHAHEPTLQSPFGLNAHAARAGARPVHTSRDDSANLAPHVWHSSITSGTISVDLPKPAMSAHEFLTAQYYVRGRRTYLEWGSGASTVLLAPLARRAVSAENQAAWCAQMNARHDVQFWKDNGVLTFQCVDTGPTGQLLESGFAFERVKAAIMLLPLKGQQP